MAGDLNARHTRWDSSTNARGRALVAWADRRSWRISAPKGKTFSGPQGESTIDIFIYRGCETYNTRIAYGDWDGCTDHNAVITYVNANRHDSARDYGRISKARRKRQDLIDKASVAYPQLIENMNKSLDKVTTTEQLNNLYTEFVNELIDPFRAKGRPPKSRTARPFWTNELQRMSRSRSKLYRKAKRSKNRRTGRDSRIWTERSKE